MKNDNSIESVETIVRLAFETLEVLPGAEVRRDPHSVLIRTGVKAALFNGVFNVRWTPQNAEQNLQSAISEFSRDLTPFMIHLSEASTPANLEELLTANGFQPEPQGIMFTLELDQVPSMGPLPEGFSVSRISSLEEIEEYLKIFVEGFALPALIAEPFRTFFLNYGFDRSKTFQNLI